MLPLFCRLNNRLALGCATMVALTLFSTPACGQGVPWWTAAGVDPGQRPVGLEVFWLADSARLLPSGGPRMLQVSVWYPTPRPRGHPILNTADYVALAAAELDSSNLAKRDVDAFRARMLAEGASADVVSKLLTSHMLAVSNAMHAPFPRFPLLIIAQGEGQSVVDQAALAEFLASNDYVVATFPPPSRVAGGTGAGDATHAAEDQAADIAFVTARVRKRDDVASRQVGLVAYGEGSMGGLLSLMRDQSAMAMISLDGQIGMKGSQEILSRAAGFNPARVNTPILHVYQDRDSATVPDFSLLGSLASKNLWRGKTRDLRHLHYTTLGAVTSAYPAVGEATGGNAFTGMEYGYLLRTALAFLDAYMKRNTDTFKRSPAIKVERIPQGG